MTGKRQILKITVDQGKLISHYGAEVKEFKDDFCEGNGWRVKHFPDGSIRCKAYLSYDSKGENAVVFKISQYGYVCLSEIRSGVKQERRRFKLRRWPVKGILGLTDGELGERYAYFQDAEYKTFLSANNICAVKKEDPSHIYTLYQCFSEELQKNTRETICTDGKVVVIGTNYGRSDEWEKKNPESYSFEKYEVVKIVGATWVIIKEENFDQDTSRRILYSLLDIETLSNLPFAEIQ